MPRTQIATPDLTALFSGDVAPPAFELRENRCETIDVADDRAPYVQSSGFRCRAVLFAVLVVFGRLGREVIVL